VLAGFAAAALAAAEPDRSPIPLRDRPILGVDTAPVVVVEVSSFKCTHCRAFHEKIFPTLREQYIKPGKVQWVVLNASDENADEFTKIFALARCAHRQGRYWEMLDSLFQVAHRAPGKLEELISRSPHLDRDELAICLRDRTVRTALAGDFAHYARLKIRGTPTFLISKSGANGQRTETAIAGAQTLAHFQRVLDEMLQAP
jgi:protein-disulfide isomerase